MALAKGNTTTSNQNPNGATQTLSHNQDAGDDKYLFVSIVMSSSVTVSSMTYNGVAMTLLGSGNYGGLTQNNHMFGLATTDSGSNNIVITFSGSQFSGTSIIAQSFTGVSGATNYASTGLVTTPNSQSMTISENSVIYATGISNNAQSFGYQIGGSTVTNSFSHNSNKIVEGAFSNLGLSAGVQNVSTIADFSTITNARVEILEAVASTINDTGMMMLLLS
jgi:hypothetical protein